MLRRAKVKVIPNLDKITSRCVRKKKDIGTLVCKTTIAKMIKTKGFDVLQEEEA